MADDHEGMDRRALVRVLGATTVGALLGVGAASNGSPPPAGPSGGRQPVELYGPDGRPLPTFTAEDPGHVRLQGSDADVPVNVVGGNAVLADSRGLVRISEPVRLTIPTYDGSGQAVHTSVVHISGVKGFANGWHGYKFWMAFTPYPHGDASYENPSIVASNDGVTWEVPPGLVNPVVPAPPVSNNSDPHLEYDYQNDQLVLFWQTNGDGRWHRKDSKDGATWGPTRDLVGMIGTSSSFVKPDYRKRQWINFSANDRPYRLESMDDGVTFSSPQRLRTPTLGVYGHLWVGLDGNGWHMLLQSAPRNRYYADSDLLYGHSRDGFNWRTFAQPVLGRSLGVERGLSIYRSSMCNVGDFYRVYYSALDTDATWHLGYFDARLAFDPWEPPEGVLVFPLFMTTAITDTEPHFAFSNDTHLQEWFPDWNDYQHRALLYFNSHDQPLTLQVVSNLRGEDTLVSGYDLIDLYNGGTPAGSALTLPPSNEYRPTLITEADLPILGQRIPTDIRMLVQAATAPTKGALSMRIAMWN